MSSYYLQIKMLIKRLSLIYGLYFLCRILFFIANSEYFEGLGIWRLLVNCFYGLRFDSFSIAVSNSLFILLSILPLRVFWNKNYQRMLKIIFILTNGIFIAVNFIDVGYYPFTKKRATSELFDQLGGQSDIGKLLPKFLADFWWIFVLFSLFVYLLIKIYTKIKLTHSPLEKKLGLKVIIAQWVVFVFIAGLTVLAIRGGFQRVPIDIVNAGSMTRPEEIPIVLNSPFTIIKSYSQQSLQALSYFDAQELKSIYNPVHHFEGGNFKKDNVVVLILESFSKEYTKLGKGKSLTPFFDSLMDHGLVFTNAFSNGTKSIEGIPAILSGLPSLMPNPFINSMYANNAQTSFANILGAEGYETAFFHGGINGTMNFNDWAALAGYQHYYGKDEYANDADFDGFWGIFDEPFLQFSIDKLNSFSQPFHAAIFTLSSHHPYLIPEKHKGKFKKTDLENSEAIAYGDYALSKFFETAKKTKWFDSTLFVLVADHTGISKDPFYTSMVGICSIPIVFYKSDNSLKGLHRPVFSQTDILPSTLNYLGYAKPFFSFGESYLEQKSGHDYIFASGGHFLLGDSTLYCYANGETTQVYNYLRDSTFSKRLLGEHPKLDSLNLRRFRAYLQTYHHSIIHNLGRIKN